MRIVFLMLCALLILTGCQPADSGDPKTYAQKMIHDEGKDSAKITNVVSGNKKYKQADDLWCVATDLTSEDGQVPYLLAVWRKAGKWDGAELSDGWYEWDLYGCPR